MFKTRLIGLMLLCVAGWAQASSLQQNFREAEIGTVIEAVAKVTGKNFIIDPRVRGKVTLIAPEPMSGDALYQTLLAILNVHGFVAVPSGDVIKVIPANLARDQLPYIGTNDKGEAWVTEVVKVKHVDASKLVAILRPLVAREGHLVAMADSNSLIVTDTVDGLVRLKAILSEVDVSTEAEYEVIRVKNASAEEMVKTLRAIAPQTQGAIGAKVAFDERSNRIILAGDAHSRLLLRALIAELDVAIPQEGRVQVIYLRYAKAKDLMPILEKMATNRSLLQASNEGAEASTEAAKAATKEAVRPDINDKGLKDRISIVADERMNALVISAPPAVLTGLKSVVKQLDIRRAQVLIEAIVVEISEAKQAELGFDWAAIGPNGVGFLNLSNNLPSVLGAVAAPTDAARATAINNLIGNSSAMAGIGQAQSNNGWAAIVSALSGDSGANILSTPTLLTLDNQEAEIIVGKEVPFRTGSYSTAAAGTNPFTTIERKNVGLKLKVRPQINQGNEVQLEIEHEISDVLPSSQSSASAADLETSKRQLKTSVIVGDGDTIVLGGLLSERETEVVNKVPGLGDVPYLGALFRYQESRREKVNLMIFLRPVIVQDVAMTNFYSQQKYSHMREQQDRLLQQDERSLLQGLRPQMPTLEEMSQGKATSPDKGQKPAAVEPVAVQPVKKTPAEQRRDSSLEMLGF